MRIFGVQTLLSFSLFIAVNAVCGNPFEVRFQPIYQPTSISEFETDVLSEMNKTRTTPTSLIQSLEKQQFQFRGRILYVPKQTPFLTNEGFPAVDEAIRVLRESPKAQSLTISEGLTKVARTQLNDLLEDPNLGHTGKDGSNLSGRLGKIGIAGKAGENITFTPLNPAEVVTKMIVDDGVKNRHHRENVMNPIFRLTGIACEKQKNRRYMCVIVFANTFTEVEPAKRLRKY